MRNPQVIEISLADVVKYRTSQDKLGSGDRSTLTMNNGRPSYQMDIGTPQLNTYLLESLWKSAALFDGILILPYLDVDSLTLWSLQTTGNTVSRNTCELFFKSQCAKQNLVAKKNNNTGKTYYERTDEFCKEYALATARRNYEAKVSSLKAMGATK